MIFTIICASILVVFFVRPFYRPGGALANC